MKIEMSTAEKIETEQQKQYVWHLTLPVPAHRSFEDDKKECYTISLVFSKRPTYHEIVVVLDRLHLEACGGDETGLYDDNPEYLHAMAPLRAIMTRDPHAFAHDVSYRGGPVQWTDFNGNDHSSTWSIARREVY